jgi:hypothetical protein
MDDWFDHLTEDFGESYPSPLVKCVVTEAIDFLEARLGRELTLDEHRITCFAYSVGNRRGHDAMRQLA